MNADLLAMAILMAGTTSIEPAQTENVSTPEIPPVPIVMATPDYPKKAIRPAIGGMVTACFTVNKRGRVRDVVIVQSSNEVFKKPVLKAARKSSFKPAMDQKKPVETQICRTYRFSLEERNS